MKPTLKRAMLSALRKKSSNGKAQKWEEIPLEDVTVEDVEFALRFVRTLSHLETQLHDSDDPAEIAKGVMKAACDFYQADWCGFLNVDMELKLWKPYWWHNTQLEDRTELLTEGFVSAEDLPRWMRAMEENDNIIVPDAEEIKDCFPEEYAVYQRMYTQSVLAAPVKPRPVGFLVVRNPKRYVHDARMLRMMAYVVQNAVNQYAEMQRARMSMSPNWIKSDQDVIINFFGDMEIYTQGHVLREREYHSPKCSRAITYLLLHPNTVFAPQSIVDTVWPEDTSPIENRCAKLRTMICNFRGKYQLMSEHPLIQTVGKNGYSINPNLNIMTDMQQFDALLDAIRGTASVSQAVDLMKQAFEIYRGPVAAAIQDDIWIKDIVSSYTLRYAGLVDELLSKLAENGDNYGIRKYATRTLAILPEHITARRWLIISLYRNGLVDMAKSEVSQAKTNLTDEEFRVLLGDLRKEKDLEKLDLSYYNCMV